jgi:class 3 adenylate cyclase
MESGGRSLGQTNGPPAGRVTILYTDMQGVIRLQEKYPDKLVAVLTRHEELLRRAFDAHDGHVFSVAGDSFGVAFQSPDDGLAAALEAQHALHGEQWGEVGPIRVRMGLHTGEPWGGVHVGVQVNHVAQLAAIARGGQIMLSAETHELLRDNLPPGVTVRDLGEYRLGDLKRPERVFQVVAPDLPENDAVDRVLATILFTDIVDSTATAVELGDQRWRALLMEHHMLVHDHLMHFRGREVRSTGDGVFAAFDMPTQAIQCAWAILVSTRRLGLDIRAGIHAGECELVADALEGVAVHLAARVAAVAKGGEVLVSSTVKELVAGSPITFADGGTHVFKGLPDEWRVWSVERKTNPA